MEYSQDNEEYLFVYGTLRSKANNPMQKLLARQGIFHGRGLMQGRLYEINGYPGAVFSSKPEHKVIGELYLIKKPYPLLTQLDQYEQCSEDYPPPWEYMRKKTRILNSDNQSEVQAWVYVYNWDISKLKLIPSGDYLNR